MTEVELTDDVILGFIRWTLLRGGVSDMEDDAEIEEMIDEYMRSRVAGG